MSRRRPGVGNVSITKLSTILLLLPLVLASPQQEQRRFQDPQNSVREEGHVDYQAQSSGQIKAYEDGASLDSNDYKNLKDTVHDSKRASAIATLAPADSSAVRAPKPAQAPGKNSGPSTLQIARSLQDWEVEDFILLATVDGSIHARDRNTGQERWALEVDRPMVETIYHSENRSDIDDFRPEDDFLWIVEPSKDGDIYLYNQGRNPGLQRLRLTVKKLAEDFSPYAGEDPAVVYTTEKKTTLFTVDAATGIITKTFSSAGSTRNDETSCRRMNRLEEIEQEECGSSGTIMLGRTEYTVNIERLDTGNPICTLKYSEWGPNNRDVDLHTKYFRTMDQKYVFPRFDGSIWGFDIDELNEDKKMRKRYVKTLPSPVVRVFDIARPAGSESRDSQLVLLPQPNGPIDSSDIYPTFEDRNRIFINQTDSGGWYAMSETKYPFSTSGAAKAQCYNRDWLEAKFATEIPSLEQRQAALVGVHSLSDRQVAGDLLTISGPPDLGNETPGPMLPGPSPIGLLRGPVTGSRAANTVIDIGVALFLMFLGALITIKRRTLIRFIRENSELKRFLPDPLEKKLDSIPSSPMVPELPIKDVKMPLPTMEEVKAETDGEATPIASRDTPLLEPPPALRSRSSTLGEDRGRFKQGAHVRIIEPSPSPGPEGDEDGTETPVPEKKKARRGCRGGVKHKKKKGQLNKGDNVKTVEKTVEEAMQIGKETSALEPDVIEVQGTSTPTDPSGPVIQIGHLRVFTDNPIGFGSHGTVVYKGMFGGRDVAVKRMLLEFYDIASHEVGLLQESDDHPNVIRYYDKESSGQFLYIALELCPASLQDVIEKPQEYSGLIGPTGLDLPDVLRQITLGLRYLHSLKIVHRDIKPQNILMSVPKKLPSNPNLFQPPRLLISDFGLCKKLEGDQSSFRATTAHAAGTTGWRAPELLVDDDASSNNSHTQTGASSSIPPSTTSDSEPLVLDTQTNRRATRAIDIFSLGCVFYFVLTNGSHPFDRDGRYMREPNVIKGHYSLDELARLGDYQWEARDLISSMIHHDPKLRPDAATVLAHPFFWSPQTRLDFLCSVSDAFEFEVRDPPSSALQALESLGPQLLKEHNNDFLKPLPQAFKDTLGKQRKYSGDKILDLLRALRNKKNHYEDMPDNVKKMVGGFPVGYLGFWTRKFPGLLMGAHRVVREVGWERKDRFRGFYDV